MKQDRLSIFRLLIITKLTNCIAVQVLRREQQAQQRVHSVFTAQLRECTRLLSNVYNNNLQHTWNSRIILLHTWHKQQAPWTKISLILLFCRCVSPSVWSRGWRPCWRRWGSWCPQRAGARGPGGFWGRVPGPSCSAPTPEPCWPRTTSLVSR